MVKLKNISCLLFFLGCSLSTLAHEIRPGYLQIEEQVPNTYNVLWKVPRTVDKVLDIQPKFENSFVLKETTAPRILEAFVLFSYQLSGHNGLPGSKLYINNLNTTGIDVLIDIRLLNGEHYSFILQPTKNEILIPHKPSKWTVASTYSILGIEHIWFGIDHLLFVLALIIITVGFKKLLKTITAFTLAHSITLSFSVLGLANLPGPPVEAVIALSIVFLALEIIKLERGQPTLTSRKPWLVAFTFGLLHGFGFAGALTEIGLPQTEIPLALAFFNIGVEVGQIIFVIIAIGAIRLLAQYKSWSPVLKQVPAYAIGSIATFWTIERIIGFWN